MMRIISFVCCIQGYVLSTTYDLEETNHGLFARMPYSGGPELVPYLVDTRSSSEENFRWGYSDYRNQIVGVLPIGPDSLYGNRASTLMLLPPSDSSESFRLIESITAPTPYCYEGTIGTAEMTPGSAISFSASLALVSSEGAVMENNTSSREDYLINTVATLDVVPREIYNTLLSEVERIGVESESDENMALLPSLQYTIYRSATSSDIVARILIYPSDYIVFESSRPLLLVRPSSSSNPPRLGLNTLEYIAILLDYQHRQIGFCEPI